MCGIVGAATRRNVAGILLEGLQRLEYRGYDSAGLSIIDASGQILPGARADRPDDVERLVPLLPSH